MGVRAGYDYMCGSLFGKISHIRIILHSVRVAGGSSISLYEILCRRNCKHSHRAMKQATPNRYGVLGNVDQFWQEGLLPSAKLGLGDKKNMAMMALLSFA